MDEKFLLATDRFAPPNATSKKAIAQTTKQVASSIPKRMKLISNPSGLRLLMIWRTDSLFYTPERKRLADEWNQVRFTSEVLPERPNLMNHSLDQPLSLPDESFDAIYGFHVMEHMNPTANERFIHDVYRLLKPGGIYRASTPNLEFLATEYLQRLREQLASASIENHARYRWAVCNLIDQCVREEPGGQMLEAIRRGEFTKEYVKRLNGDSFDFLFQPAQGANPSGSGPSAVDSQRKPMTFLRKIAQAIRGRLRLGSPRNSFFELSHERNLWMWDRLSLGRLFSEAGFRNVAVVDYRTSSIPGWSRYNFDQSVYGDYPLEPSLFMEGSKSAAA